MSAYQQEMCLPYGCGALFDLVADIEKYPEFVPGYREARVTRRQGHVLEVFQTVGLGPLRLGFRSLAELARPERITVRALDNPFADLNIDWRFCEEGQACRLRFCADYRLRGALPAGVAGRWLDGLNARVLQAFAARARRVLGSGGLLAGSEA